MTIRGAIILHQLFNNKWELTAFDTWHYLALQDLSFKT